MNSAGKTSSTCRSTPNGHRLISGQDITSTENIARCAGLTSAQCGCQGNWERKRNNLSGWNTETTDLFSRLCILSVSLANCFYHRIKMFSDELEKISWEETTRRINAKTDADVRRALSKEHCDVEDFMALISPAAVPYLETMARLSKKYTEERFGKTISMFVPLYITNSCTTRACTAVSTSAIPCPAPY